MEPFTPRKKKGPEAELQERIVEYLEARAWVVMVTHGNVYQHGFPDLYATHHLYGPRWIEVKLPTGSVLTPSQIKNFPRLATNGSPIWFMQYCSENSYNSLFKSSNFWPVFESLGGPSRVRYDEIQAAELRRRKH